MSVTFSYQRLRDSKGHFYQVTATFKPAIVIPSYWLKAEPRRIEATILEVYRRVRKPMGDFLSRFATKSGVTHWHFIMEERVLTSIPIEAQTATLEDIAEQYREIAIVVSAPTVPRKTTTFKPFFIDGFNVCINESGLGNDSALYLFVYTISARAYLRSKGGGA